MRQDSAIAVFVKTPSLSPVKTRLATDIGKERAEEFYKLCLRAVAETLKDVNAAAYWAVGEENGLGDALWRDFQQIYTGPGNLGERQSHVYETLCNSYRKVLLIGADAPQTTPLDFQKALDHLADHDYVIGPANDGGYYLFGGRASLKKEIWASVTYSTATTCEDLISRLPSKPFMLPPLTDADTADCLSHIEAEMPVNSSSGQYKIINWIRSVAVDQINTAKR